MDETVARCMLLAKVLAADGETTGTEHAFLERAMNKLSLDEADRERVRALEEWDLALSAIASLDEATKRSIMESVVHAVIADGKVSPEEMATIERINTGLGLT